MSKYDQLDGISRQVIIEQAGYQQQVDISVFEAYYRHIGWQMVGRATPLPVIGEIRPLHRQGNLI